MPHMNLRAVKKEPAPVDIGDSDVSPSGSFGNPCGVGCGDHGSASEDKLRLWRMDGPTQPQEPPWLIHKCPYCKYGGLI